MPFNFLELSKSYCRGVPAKVRERRTKIAELLDDSYDSGNRTTAGITKLLFEAGIETKVFNVGIDISMFRTAFRYFNGTSEEKRLICERVAKANMEKKNPRELYGVMSFMEDGVETWEQVLALLPKKDSDSEQFDAGEDATDKIETEITHIIGEIGDEKDQNFGEVPDVASIAQQVVGMLHQATDSTSTFISVLFTELNHVKEEASRLRSEIILLRERKEQLDLELRKISTSRALDAVLEVASSFGDPNVAAKMVERFQEAQQRAVTQLEEKELLVLAPKKICNNGNTPFSVEYESSFIHDLSKRTPKEQEDALQTLIDLAEKGFSYPSLDAKRYNSQIGGTTGYTEITVKGTIWRIYLKTCDGVVHIYRLLHKRDQTG